MERSLTQQRILEDQWAPLLTANLEIKQQLLSLAGVSSWAGGDNIFETKHIPVVCNDNMSSFCMWIYRRFDQSFEGAANVPEERNC